MATNAVDILVLDGGKRTRCTTQDLSTTADDNTGSNTTASGLLIGTAVDDAEDCCRQRFNTSMVACGLSQLGLSASGTQQVFQKLEVTQTDLDNPQAVVHCQHIQNLVLSSNCLTTLQPLTQLKHLTNLDVSHNQLTEVLYHQASPLFSKPDSSSHRAAQVRSSNLRKADLSYNAISSIRDLSQHSNLRELNLAGNSLKRIDRGLEALMRLRRLDLSSNCISSCQGLAGLCSLQELSLDGNRLSSLQPLSCLTGLQVLHAAHNVVSSLDGAQGLSSLRVLDVGGNQLRRVEVLAACRGLTLMTDLNISGNPLEAVQDARLHVVHLLTQLQQLNGVKVAVVEKVDAANLVGGATDGLVAIRNQFFPYGELEDGGGAVPPTAAGLKVSHADEERSCTDIGSMFAAIDGWAQSVQPDLALQPLSTAQGLRAARTTSLSAHTAAATAGGGLAARTSTAGASARQSAAGQLQREGSACAELPWCGAATRTGSAARVSNSSAGRISSSSARRISSSGSEQAYKQQPSAKQPEPSAAPGGIAAIAAKQPPAQPGGIAAIAARLAAGCCLEAPYRQLQLLRVCHTWVLKYVQLPKECDLEAGADLVTWDVGRHVFGEQEREVLLHEVLLAGYSGTWAEAVSQLLVGLLRECGLEAAQLSGFWKAGGRASVGPGQRLASHNHSWVAAKVNGAWRLLDPVCSLIMASRDQPLPFFLPPEVFIHTHLPFEPCWQLLAQPLRPDDWWARPELALGFAAAGGRLLDAGSLQACVVTQPQLDTTLQGHVLPVLKVPVAAPANAQQRLCISVLDADLQPLVTWHQPSPRASAHTSATASASAAGAGSVCSTAAEAAAAEDAGLSHSMQLNSSQKEHMQLQQGRTDSGLEAFGRRLVFQQRVLGSADVQQARLGPVDVQLEAQELWAALPGPGTFSVKVTKVTEVPGGLLPAVHIEGLQEPLSLTMRQHLDVMHLKVIVSSVDSPDNQSAGTSSCQGEAAASSSSSSSSDSGAGQPLVVAYLPEPQLASYSAAAAATGAGESRRMSEATATAAAAAAVQVQLMEPQPGTLLVADRSCFFRVLAPQWASVAVGAPQCGWQFLQRVDGGDASMQGSGGGVTAAADGASGLAVFAGSVYLPRVSACFVAVQDAGHQGQAAGAAAGLRVLEMQLAGQSSVADASSRASWEPVLALRVLPPVQDLVPVQEAGASSSGGTGEGDSPLHGSAAHLLSALDVDGDGAVSRKDMLLAFRRDRQLADHLRIPAKIRAGDGTFDTFLSKYITINSSGLGLVSVQELSAYLFGLMGARGSSRGREGVGSRVPTAASSSSRVVTAASGGTSPGPKSSGASSRTGSALRQKLAVSGGMSG